MPVGIHDMSKRRERELSSSLKLNEIFEFKTTTDLHFVLNRRTIGR